MGKRLSKRFKEIGGKIDRNKNYTISEAVNLLKEQPSVKFDQTIDISCNLNVDPKKSDQVVRGSVVLPHGLGKEVKVLVFCKGEQEKEAKSSGADFAGLDELVEKIKSGWVDFDVAIATPDAMREVGKIGKILGPRKLMPSPKTGTVTDQIARAVKEAKSGKLDFKMDREGNISVGVGKLSFSSDDIVGNIKVFFDSLIKAKPASSKGQFIKKVSISSTMGPGLKIFLSEVAK